MVDQDVADPADETDDDDLPDSEGPGILDEAISRATVNLAAKTLKGDLRDVLLDLFRNREKPWQQLSEGEQRDLSHQLDSAAATLVRKICLMLAAGGRVTAPAELTVFKQKGTDIVAQLELYANADTVRALSKACGHQVQLVFVDPSAYLGARAPAGAAAEPDEPELGLEDPDGPDIDDEIEEEADDEAVAEAAE